jgi:hypothetical protein
VPSIRSCDIPEGSLLRDYQLGGSYADCFVTDICKPVSHAQYVEAFYTTALFKAERLILTAISRPSSDQEARELAVGSRESFAAWRVEERSQDQLLLAAGHTRSWLMTAALPGHGSAATRLYFGSAVVPTKNARTGRVELGTVFRALLGFHKGYARALLFAARSKLEGN